MLRFVGRMVIAHHPEKALPYEFTKPLPQKTIENKTILKKVHQDIFNEGPNLEQLQALTYTHHTYWNQNNTLKLRKEYRDFFNDTEDRKGLTS